MTGIGSFNKECRTLYVTGVSMGTDGINAQKKHRAISSLNRTFYAGAYWGNGFHEDGVKSAYDAVNQLNGLVT